MKKIINIFIIPVFLIFTQIHPIFHWHNHEIHNDVELDLCIQLENQHPDNCKNKNFHAHHDAHKKNETQCTGDWYYTLKVKTKTISHNIQSFFISEAVDDSPQVSNSNHKETPTKLQRSYLQEIFSDRAPPYFC